MPLQRPSGSPRTSTAAWKRTRLAVLARDGHQCTIVEHDGIRCLEPANEVHHIVQPVKGGTDDMDNLVALCQWHHARITAKQVAEARRANPNGRSARPAEPHPGIVG